MAERLMLEMAHYVDSGDLPPAPQEGPQSDVRRLTLVPRDDPDAREARIRGLVNHGMFLLETGHSGDARACFDQVLCRRRAAPLDAIAVALYGLALDDHLHHRLDRADSHYRDALDRSAEVGDGRLQADCQTRYGLLQFERGRLAEARILLLRACALLASSGTCAAQLHLCRAYLAIIECERGHHGIARELWRTPSAWAEDREKTLEQAAARRARDILGRTLPFNAGLPPAVADEAFGGVDLAGTIDGRLASHIATMLDERNRRAQHGHLLAPTLRVHATGRWFELPSGQRIHLGRHRTVRALLLSIAGARVRSGSTLSRSELVSAVWNNEKMGDKHSKNRFRVSLARLRKLGLGSLLQTSRRSCGLDPSVTVVLVDDDESNLAGGVAS